MERDGEGERKEARGREREMFLGTQGRPPIPLP